MNGGEVDRGACASCGGRIAATHMLTKTYELGPGGAWVRSFADFLEDVVVVCASCGLEPAGRFDADDGAFKFIPAGVESEPAPGGDDSARDSDERVL